MSNQPSQGYYQMYDTNVYPQQNMSTMNGNMYNNNNNNQNNMVYDPHKAFHQMQTQSVINNGFPYSNTYTQMPGYYNSTLTNNNQININMNNNHNNNSKNSSNNNNHNGSSSHKKPKKKKKKSKPLPPLNNNNNNNNSNSNNNIYQNGYMSNIYSSQTNLTMFNNNNNNHNGNVNTIQSYSQSHQQLPNINKMRNGSTKITNKIDKKHGKSRKKKKIPGPPGNLPPPPPPPTQPKLPNGPQQNNDYGLQAPDQQFVQAVGYYSAYQPFGYIQPNVYIYTLYYINIFYL